jgi:sec-independent protein translocase protein TatA
MIGDLQPWHVIVILAVLVLLFGSRKLPTAARSVGQSLRIFKSEMRQAASDDEPASTAAAQPPKAVEPGVTAPTPAAPTPTANEHVSNQS